MTASTKPDLTQVAALRRRAIDPALGEDLRISLHILPEPPSADPHGRWCGEGTSLATRLGAYQREVAAHFVTKYQLF